MALNLPLCSESNQFRGPAYRIIIAAITRKTTNATKSLVFILSLLPRGRLRLEPQPQEHREFLACNALHRTTH
jgi:hypothetical protein